MAQGAADKLSFPEPATAKCLSCHQGVSVRWCQKIGHSGTESPLLPLSLDSCLHSGWHRMAVSAISEASHRTAMPMTEADTCRKFVVPALQRAGWDSEPHRIAE